MQLPGVAPRARVLARTVTLARAALAVAALGACATWRPLGGGAPASYPTRLPYEVRVAVTGQPRPVYLRAPQVAGDSLAGWQTAGPGRPTGRRVAWPLTAVAAVDAQRVSAGRTAWLAIGVLAVLLGLGAAAYVATEL